MPSNRYIIRFVNIKFWDSCHVNLTALLQIINTADLRISEVRFVSYRFHRDVTIQHPRRPAVEILIIAFFLIVLAIENANFPSFYVQIEIQPHCSCIFPLYFHRWETAIGFNSSNVLNMPLCAVANGEIKIARLYPSLVCNCNVDICCLSPLWILWIDIKAFDHEV